jgi:hypothetical protein
LVVFDCWWRRIDPDHLLLTPTLQCRETHAQQQDKVSLAWRLRDTLHLGLQGPEEGAV